MALSPHSVQKERLLERGRRRGPAPERRWPGPPTKRAEQPSDPIRLDNPAVPLPLISQHAAWRMAQRRLAAEAVGLTLLYGTELRRAGAVFYSMGRKDLAWDGSLSRRNEQLHGVTVVMDQAEQVILTAYRSRTAHQRLKQKSRRSLRPRFSLAGR